MFLDFKIGLGAIITLPFIIIILIPTLLAIIYFVYLVFLTIRYRIKLGINNLENVFVEETTSIPNYEPAIMGYLVNCQKIGRREICSTLFDLIGKDVIKIVLKSGFVSDDDAKYILKLNEEKIDQLNGFEVSLIKYLFRNTKSIKSETLHKRLYKKNMSDKFYNDFLRLIQAKAKTYDFFDKKTGKRKMKVYKIVNKVVTVIASIASFMGSLIFSVDELDGDGEILYIIIISLISAGILWGLKFLITFMFNLTCFYNDFSERGNVDYKKWLGFKKYLKNYSLISNHPLMGVMIWERYYAYAIGLKCSKKFFKQMKKMKVVDNSIDIKMFETLNDIVDCIGTSTKKIKKISLDEYGGSHVDY